jgi:hypothetical protein
MANNIVRFSDANNLSDSTRQAVEEPVILSQNEVLKLATIENENLKLQNENLKLQLQFTAAQQELESFRHAIVTTCPEPTVLKVLGCKEIHTVVYRDRVIVENEDDQRWREGK